MKKQIALILLISIAMSAAPTLAMDQNKKPQPQQVTNLNEKNKNFCKDGASRMLHEEDPVLIAKCAVGLAALGTIAGFAFNFLFDR